MLDISGRVGKIHHIAVGVIEVEVFIVADERTIQIASTEVVGRYFVIVQLRDHIVAVVDEVDLLTVHRLGLAQTGRPVSLRGIRIIVGHTDQLVKSIIHAGFRRVKGIVDPDFLFHLIAVVVVGIFGDGLGTALVLFALQQAVVGIVPVINGVVLVAGCNQLGAVTEIVKRIFISLDNVTVIFLLKYKKGD